MELYRWLFVLAALLAVAFCVMLAVDYHTYVTAFGSAPYYAYVLIRAGEFLLPGAVVLLVAVLLKRKKQK